VADTGVVEVGMDQLALRVRQLVEAIESYRRTTADVLGVGMSGTNALAELWFHGPSTPTSLADRVGLTSPSVTALVDRLEAAGMVARRRHPADRRSVIIELTHTGSATLQTAVGLVSDRISAAVEQETPERVEELQRMLEQIAASLRSGAEDRSGIAAALGRQALPGSVTRIPSPRRNRRCRRICTRRPSSDTPLRSGRHPLVAAHASAPSAADTGYMLRAWKGASSGTGCSDSSWTTFWRTGSPG